jgi:hypothetical protein
MFQQVPSPEGINLYRQVAHSSRYRELCPCTLEFTYWQQSSRDSTGRVAHPKFSESKHSLKSGCPILPQFYRGRVG